jgi:hypothetical protein
MRLPSNILAALLAAGTACEKAPPTESCKTPTVEVETDSTPLDEIVRMAHERKPAVAPKPQPPPPTPVVRPSQPQPPAPVIQKKGKPRMVWASICGHTELVNEHDALVKCGKG